MEYRVLMAILHPGQLFIAGSHWFEELVDWGILQGDMPTLAELFCRCHGLAVQAEYL
jgi:hypothetical protein